MCRFCVRGDCDGQFTRREVLGVAGAGLAAGLTAPMMLTAAEGAAAKPGPDDPLDVRVVYARPKGRQWLGWPGTFWDPESFTGKSRALVEEFGKQLGMKVSFEPAPIHEPAEVEAFVKKVKAERPKGVIVFPLNADEFISGTIDKIAQSGIPTVIFCGLGMFHTGFAGCRGAHREAQRGVSPLVERFRARAGAVRNEDDPGGLSSAPHQGGGAPRHRDGRAEDGAAGAYDPLPAAAAVPRHAQDHPGNARSRRHGRGVRQGRQEGDRADAGRLDQCREELLRLAARSWKKKGARAFPWIAWGWSATARFPRRRVCRGLACWTAAAAAPARPTSTP